MFLIELAVASGVAYAGIRAYTARQPQKGSAPMVTVLVESEQTPPQQRPLSHPTVFTALYMRGKSAMHEGVEPLLDNLYASCEHVVVTRLVPLFSLSTHQGTQALPHHHEPREISPEEQRINRRITLSAIALGMTTVGALISPVVPLLSLPLMIYLGVRFIKDAYHEVVHDHWIGIHSLNAVFTVAVISTGHYFAYTIFCVVYSGADKIILRTQDSAMQSLLDIFGELPHSVWLLQDGSEVQTPLEEVQVGQTVIVNTGETIPVDGVITTGMATIDQHMLTGEAQPAEKSEGDQVFAATMVLSGKIYVKVEKTGSDTVTAQIGEILRNTVDYKASIMLRGAYIADRTSLPVLLLSGLSLPLVGSRGAAAVLLAHFGYDVRFTGPISVLNHLHIAARQHVLVKDGRALEALRQTDTVVFDKTGTLTQEQPHVTAVHPFNGYSENDVLRYAAAAEYRQAHPIAQAILQAAHRYELELPPLDDASYEIGYGLRVRIGAHLVRVGSARFMTMEGIPFPDSLQEIQDRCHLYGHSLVYVAFDDTLGGALELRPTIRPEAQQVIDGLKARGLDVYVISGDHEVPTRHLTQQLGIERYFAEVLPQDKSALIIQLQQEGRKVCFVGDGINDSIALKQANVSVSLRGAASIATDTAQIILMDSSLNRLVPMFELAHDLSFNLNMCLVASVVPCLISLLGVYGLNFGVLTASILDNAGLVVGVGNAMLPLAQHRDEEVQDKKPALDTLEGTAHAV